MPEGESALSLDSAANEILSMLGDDNDDSWSPPEPELEDDDREIERLLAEATSDGAAAPDAEAEAATPIRPPASWKADAKERFKDLPPDLQQTIAEREREREAHFSKTQQDAAQVRKAVEAEPKAAQQERHANLQTTSLLLEAFQTLDPVIAEGMKTDWAKLSAENPAAAQSKWAQYQQHLQRMKGLEERRGHAMQAAHADHVRHTDRTLHQHLPFWRDGQRRLAFLNALDGYLHQCGFTPQERGTLADPRAIMIAREAMLYRQLMAQQAQIGARRRQGGNGRVLRPQASSDSFEGSARARALAKRADRTGRLDDQAAAILAALD